MIRYFISGLFFTSLLFSAPLQWSNNYHLARQTAKKLNKHILFLIYSKNNPYCEYMQEDIFKDTVVAKYINQDYIAVRLLVNNNKTNIPRAIEFFSTPSVYFLTYKGKYFHKKYKRITGEVTTKQMRKILATIKKDSLTKQQAPVPNLYQMPF